MQLRNHGAIVSKRDAFMIDPRKIKVEKGFNVRDLQTPYALDNLEQLKLSIIQNGVLKPIEIRLEGEDIYITDGHRRLAAVLAAIKEGHDIVAIPALAEDKKVDEAQRTLNLAIANDGVPLTPMERAQVVRRLANFGWSRAMIAERMGYKSENPVIAMEQLLAAPAEIKTMVDTGQVSATTAARVMKNSSTPAKATATLTKAADVAAKAGKKKVTDAHINEASNIETLPASKMRFLTDGLRRIANMSETDQVSTAIRHAKKALQAAGLKLTF